MPHDLSASIPEQVRSSIVASLHNFRHSEDQSLDQQPPYIDCLLLRWPYASQDMVKEAWVAMQSAVPHQVRALGISGIHDLEVLRDLYHFATVKPSVVQNRMDHAHRCNESYARSAPVRVSRIKHVQR